MKHTQTAPYGSWKSPITSDLIVSRTIGLGQVILDGPDTYWVESRPAEKGRAVIMRHSPDGVLAEVTPAPFSARTRAHEYGGGAFTVVDGTIYFSNDPDGRLYRQAPGQPPQPLTPESKRRYADLVVDARRGRLIGVREDHTPSDREAITTLVSLPLAGGEVRVLAEEYDFYSSPALSPDGSHLAWLAWRHPQMPWDGTELWLAAIAADGALAEPVRLAGGPDESIFQPAWSPDGRLYFVSDRTGWWNLYRWHEGGIEQLTNMEVEFGRPQWVFGLSTYDFESAGRLVCAYTQQGIWRLGVLDTATRQLQPVDTPYTEIDTLRAGPGRAVLVAGSPTELKAVVQLDLETQQRNILRRSGSVDLDPGYLSIPRAIEFPTAGGQTAHAFFYPPQNRDFNAPAGESPPLLVRSHGGPTDAVSSTLSLSIQYWTSRGFAYLEVNYGGSTGYGRAYRQRLEDNWGVVDVDDCANGARYLVEQGQVDGRRLVIRGSSAGGYTTLCALTFRDTFQAGASYYGISDAEALATDTHKFESRYGDRLIGPYPERRDLYRARSPIHFTGRLARPVIFFQGLEDKVVPPDQSERMAEALRARGVPVAYLAFKGEGHGFRRAENIKRSLDAELYFYGRIFGFEPAEAVEPVLIENL